MRSLELILSVLALFSAAALFLPKFPALWKSKILPAILGLAVLAQLFFEGFRWQLWPLMIAILLFVLLVWPLRKAEGKDYFLAGCPPGIDLNRRRGDFPHS